MLKVLFSILAYLAVCNTAYTAPAPSLSVSFSGNSSAMVNTPTRFTVTVNNTGNSNASNVSLKVKLPLTGTSPQVYVLGEVQTSDLRCSIINREINCNLSTINKRTNKQVNFDFKFPQSSRALSFVATSYIGSTASGSATLTPSIDHPALEINQDVTVLNSHCTGSSSLSSYFECLLFQNQGAISSHSANFSSSGDITIDNEPTITGRWEQASDKKNLNFTYFDNGEKILEFVGFAIDDKCFEGMANFFPASTYVSPYHVCLP